jgi:hypothetical protein
MKNKLCNREDGARFPCIFIQEAGFQLSQRDLRKVPFLTHQTFRWILSDSFSLPDHRILRKNLGACYASENLPVRGMGAGHCYPWTRTKVILSPCFC